MDDAHIRREYFRRFAALVFSSVAIAIVVVIPVIYLNPIHKNHFTTWLLLSTVLFSGGVLTLAANFYLRRRKPLFARAQVEGPRSLAASFCYGAFFFIAVSIVPDLLEGDLDWKLELLSGMVVLVSVGPPWVRFWEWQDRLLNDLPHTSSLIEPPTRLPA